MRGKEKKKEEKEGESGISLLRTVSRKFSGGNEEREREIERYLLVVRSSEDTISLNEWYRKPAAGGFASRWTLMRWTIYGVNAAN